MATFSNTPRPAYVYEAATDQWIPVGFGPHTHAVTDVTNAFNTTTVTAKGDLVVAAGSNSVTKLAVGGNGESLVADSSTTTGLRWTSSQANKNLLINGAFDIWQRGTTFAPGSITNAYGGDRWKCTYDDSLSGLTMSRVDISDLNLGFKYAVSLKNTIGTKANANVRLQQAFETHDTHMMRGKTYTLSFYARKVSGSSVRITHMAGWTTTETNGFGSSDEIQVVVPNASLTTTFQRFSQTFVASTNASYNSLKIQLDFQFLTSLNDELQVTGVQLEQGSVATPFSRAGGTLQGELAACQRYYYRLTSTGYNRFAIAQCITSNTAQSVFALPLQFRAAPTALEQTGTASNYALTSSSGSPLTCSAVPSFDISNANYVSILFTVASGLTAGHATQAISNAVSAFLGVSAEI